MTSLPTRLALASLLLAPVACRSAAEYREEADREAYAILDEVRSKLAVEGTFRLERPPERLRVRLEADPTQELPPLGLVDVLQIGAQNSREFQSRREALFLQALDLTLQRWSFSVQEAGVLSAFLDGDRDGATLAGGAGALSLAKLFESGARALGSIGVDFVRNVSTGDAWGAFTSLSLNVTQPILRGFGRDVVREPLTQAERDVLYEARTYERFRRTFAVDAATRYFRVLEQADTLKNEELNYKNLTQLRERNEAFAEAGLLSDIQVDQARQDELRAENRLVEARRSLDERKDELKLFLGLPVEVPLELDPSELERIDRFGDALSDLSSEQAAAIGLRERLDHATVLDQVEDAARRVHVLADALRPGLDARVDVNAVSEQDRPLSFSRQGVSWGLGLDLDLALDRLPQRNAYRAALIALEVEQRDAERSRDEILLEVRDALRTLLAARQSLEIQSGAVTLAERRVESAALNLEAGRASTRDLLEAQESLVQAQNAATAARIDMLLAELSLLRDLEVLRVDADGLGVDVERLRPIPPPEGVTP